MGVIQKQTIQGTLYTYLGAALGVVTNLILLAWYLEPEEVGLLNILVAYAVLFAQVSNLGFDNVTLRLFPWFRNEAKGHHGYLFIMTMVCLTGFLLATGLFFLIKPWIVANSSDESDLLGKYILFVVPLAFFSLFFYAYEAYARVLYKSVRGIFLKEFLQRLLIILVLLLYVAGWVGFGGLVAWYVAAISLPTVIMAVLFIRDRQYSHRPHHGFITPDLRRNMVSVSFFGIIAVFSGSVIVYIDKIMVEQMLGMAETGIYSVTFYFGTLILMPSRSMSKIASTVIAEAWKVSDLKTIKDVYYKSCINQMIFSALLFAGIWGNIDNVFQILPDEYAAGRWVIFWVCLASFIDMSTGVNSTVIGTSPYYKAQSLFMTIFVGIIVVTNLIFIPLMGMEGAGLASAISLFAFNFMRWAFLYARYGMQPFNYKYLLVLIFGGAAWYLSTLIPQTGGVVADILVRSSVITVVFMVPVVMLGISEDINGKLRKVFSRFIH